MKIGVFVNRDNTRPAPTKCTIKLLENLKEVAEEDKIIEVNSYQVEDLDLLHLHRLPLYPSELVSTTKADRVTASVHGDIHYTYPEYSLKSPVKMKGLKILQRINKTTVDHFFPVSNYLKETISNNLDISESKMSVLYNGIDDVFKDLNKNKTNYVKKKYNTSDNFLFHVSTNRPVKNVKTTLYAFKLLKEDGYSQKLIIAGCKFNKKGLLERISNLSLEDSVEVLDYIPKKDLVSLYNEADLFVNPTIHETFGLTNIEAMRCGCPVVSSKNTSIPEVTGGKAILIEGVENERELKEAIKLVLENKSIKNKISREGKKWSKRFTWEKTAKRALKYFHLLGD